MLKAMRMLAKMKGLRGSALDPFARTHDRKLDRRLIADYERVIEEVLAKLDAANHDTAVELAQLPEQMRGFGPVRERYVANAKKREATLLDALRNGGGATPSAARGERRTIQVVPA